MTENADYKVADISLTQWGPAALAESPIEFF